MKTTALRFLAAALAIALVAPAVGQAQDVAAPAAVAPAPNSAPLASILAPVALYPDPLLTNILAASTYPLEVVDADRWLAEPGHAGLSGDALLAQLQQKDWDPSVKSLVPFPQILKLMDTQLDWTQQLGNAFLSQQAQVMDTVQFLRRQAQAVGALGNTPQQIVSNNAGDVEIEPANPEQVSVPSYQPAVYGDWPYPDAPPLDLVADEPGLYDAAYDGGWYFGPPVVLVSPIWFWGRCDWHHHRVEIDRERFGQLNPWHPFTASTVWQHDPAHRRGVAYNDLGLQQRYQPNREAAPRPIPTVNGQPADRPAQYRPLIESRPPPPSPAMSRPPSPQAQPQRAPQPQPQRMIQEPPQRVPQAPTFTQPAPARVPAAPGAHPPSRPILPGRYESPSAPSRQMMPTTISAGPSGFVHR